jgi:stearoyl-CoA desaturase (Delta-9 desaturase)
VPKPNRAAQQFYDGARRVAFTENIYAKEKSTEVPRHKNVTDKIYIGFIALMHVLCLALPLTFSMRNLALFGVTYFVTGCLGITLSFHRQLAHKSFRTPKWLEYALAYCGALAVQGDPKEWVSTHRCAHCLRSRSRCALRHVLLHMYNSLHSRIHIVDIGIPCRRDCSARIRASTWCHP